MKSIRILAAVTAAFAVSIFLHGCASLQKDLVMSTDSLVQTEDVLSIEKKMAYLDARIILEEKNFPVQERKEGCDEIESDIKKAISDAGMNKALLARLYALSGRNALFMEQKSKAKDFLEKSVSSCKGDSQTIILESRLGLIKDLEDENLVSGSNENNLLMLETGLSFYREGKYPEAIARLDTAFIALPAFYKEAYARIRENAWNLREISNESGDRKLFALLNQSSFSLSDMIAMTQENSDLFNEITGGTKISVNELYNRLQKAGMFDAKSVTPSGKVKPLSKNQVMTRILCARFLWNLYSFRKDLGDKAVRFSRIYREKNMASPVPDVDRDSEDFDAVIGTVENEIIPLPDGKNFFPEQNPAAAEYNSWMKKVN